LKLGELSKPFNRQYCHGARGDLAKLQNAMLFWKTESSGNPTKAMFFFFGTLAALYTNAISLPSSAFRGLQQLVHIV
jgi:hypothetical protein